MSSTPEKTEEEWDELLKRMIELDEAVDKNTYYVYCFYDPKKKTFVHIGRGNERCAKYKIREKARLTTVKSHRAYKYAIQDRLDSTGLKIVRLFTKLPLNYSRDYKAAMLLANGGAINKTSGLFRGPFINFTKNEKIAEGKCLLEEAKKICESDEHPIYTRANIEDFKPTYIPITGYCMECDVGNLELVDGSFCQKCDTDRLLVKEANPQIDEASGEGSSDDDE